MGSLKGLFLGVYASNSVIRTLFLPLCYLLLSSPFLLFLARYFGIDSRLFELFGKDKSVKEIALQLFVGLVAASLPTRYLSGKNWNLDQNGGTRRVQQIPYWIPQVRHWGSVVFGGEGWLKKVRCVETLEKIDIGTDKLSGIRHSHLLLLSTLEARSITSYCRPHYWSKFRKIQPDWTKSIS